MAKDLIENITKTLQDFEISIRETDEHFDELGWSGRYQAVSPYYHKTRLLSHLAKLGTPHPEYPRFQLEYCRLLRVLTFLENRRGDEYREKILDFINKSVDNFRHHLDYFPEPDDQGFNLELGNDLQGRDNIDFLLKEFEGVLDLRDSIEKLEAADTVLYAKYAEFIEGIVDIGGIEKPDAPDRFWWRHPSKHPEYIPENQLEMLSDSEKLAYFDRRYKELASEIITKYGVTIRGIQGIRFRAKEHLSRIQAFLGMRCTMAWADKSKEYWQQARPQFQLMQQNYEWGVLEQNSWGYDIGLSEYHRKAGSLLNRRDNGIELYYLPSSYPGLAFIWQDDALVVFDRVERELAEGTIEGNILRFYRVGEDAESADRHIQARMNVDGLIRLT